MMRCLAQLDLSAFPCYFVTLTFHHEWGGYAERYAAFRAFYKRLKRRWDSVRLYWKVEQVERKSGLEVGLMAPHYHLLVFLPVRIPAKEFERWVRPVWCALRPGDKSYYDAAADVRACRNTTGSQVGKLLAYLCKYMAKETDSLEGCGRYWGHLGKLPVVVMGVRFTVSAWLEFCDKINERGRSEGVAYWEKISPKWRGFFLWGDGLEWMDWMPDEGVDFSPNGLGYV